MKGRALIDEEIIKVWHASGKLGAFGQLARMCLLGGPRRSEPTMIEWRKHIMDDRITFDAAWTKMGLHHDVPRTHLVDEVLAAANISSARRPTMSSRHRRPAARCRA
jgi:hypothetical protein